MKHVASLDLSTASTSVDLAGHDTRRRASATSATPATSFAARWARGGGPARAVRGARHPHQRRCDARTSAAPPSAYPTSCASCCSRSRRSSRSAVPVLMVGALVYRRRWRRLGVVTLAATAGAAVFALLDLAFDIGARVPDAVTGDTWIASTDFPSLTYVAGAAAIVTAGTPWLSRSWRRCAVLTLLGVVAVLAIAGTAGVPELLLALATGVMAGAAVLIVVGAPNRRPAPAVVVVALRDAGLAVDRLALERADGGRAQLYTATLDDGGARVREGLRTRQPRCRPPVPELPHAAVAGPERRPAGVEPRAGRRARGAAPADRGASRRHLSAAGGAHRVADGSMALAVEYVDGTPLDALEPEAIDDTLLDARGVTSGNSMRRGWRIGRSGPRTSSCPAPTR